MLVGAIVAVVALNIATEQAYIYPQTRVVAQVLTGAYVGCMVTREDLVRLKELMRPFLVMLASLLCLNLLVGTFIYWVTDLDLLTSLFCAAPGGITDMPLVAMEMGANVTVVAVMQFVRMLFGMGCLPTIILLTDRLVEPEHARELDEKEKTDPRKKKKKASSLRKFLPTFAVALCAGILGKLSGMPAGTMAFSLVAVVTLKLLASAPPMPMWVRRCAQVVTGCCIGASVTRAQLFQLRQMVLPAAVLCLGYILCCLGMGYVVSRVFKMELREAMLSLAPAGASEMALVAADMGINSTNVVVIQICRLLSVTVLFPQIFSLIVGIFG